MAQQQYKTDLDHLKKLLASAKASRSRLEADWYLNLAYYMGDQWVFWNRGRIDRPKLEGWRVQFVDNRILPTVVARVAKATKNRPSFICTPRTGEDDDMSSAELGERILSYDWKELNLDQKHLLAEFWKEICGAGFWKVYWDKSKGNSAEFLFVNGHPLNAEGKPMEGKQAPLRSDAPHAETVSGIYAAQGMSIEAKPLATGDVCVEVISPFELYPDPLASSIEECEWVIEEKIRSKEYIQKAYGISEVTEDAEVPVGIVESRTVSSTTPINSKEQAKGVKVYEYFCRPNSQDPEGKWVVWFNDKIQYECGCNQSPFADFPYVMFSSNLVPGRFWPTSITSQLRGPQTDLNKLQSQIRENAIRIGNPAVALAREANVEWTGKPGEAVMFSDTAQNALPSFITPPEVPSYVRQEVDRIETSITEISGLHEISNAQVPSGITAASAINLLQEADDTRLGPEIQMMERTIAQAGDKLLKLHARFTSDTRTLRLAGEDGGWDIEEFKGEMLESVMDVDVQAGSGMPQSKAARQAAMQELLALALQYGVPLNQRSMRRFFQDYEMGGLDRLFQDLEKDESQITRENRRLYEGETFGINDFDDDDLHIEGHEEEMKTAKWEKQPVEIKGAFLAHWKLHKERRIKAVNEQVQAAQGEARQAAFNEQEHDLKQIMAKRAAKETASGLE